MHLSEDVFRDLLICGTIYCANQLVRRILCLGVNGYAHKPPVVYLPTSKVAVISAGIT